MTETTRAEEQYPKHRQSFEEAVKTAIECAGVAQDERGYFDAVDMFGGQGEGYVFASSTHGVGGYTVLTGLGSEIPRTVEGAEAHIRRLDRMTGGDTLTYLGSVAGSRYSGRSPEGEPVEYKMAERRELLKTQTPGE